MEDGIKLTITASTNGVQMATYTRDGIVTRIWQMPDESPPQFTQRIIDTFLK